MRNKGTQGRVLVIAGSAAMPGASALAVLGALRSGFGSRIESDEANVDWSGGNARVHERSASIFR